MLWTGFLQLMGLQRWGAVGLGAVEKRPTEPTCWLRRLGRAKALELTTDSGPRVWDCRLG